MQMKFILFLIAFSSFHSIAQPIRGKVVDSASGKPLLNASVFISNTSIGTLTDNQGEFTLTRFPSNSFDLVISYVGYNVISFKANSPSDVLFVIKLTPKKDELREVTVTPYEKNGWDKWGFLFENNFLGITPLSRQCEILNKKKIKFQYSSAKEMVYAFCDEPIIVINKALGYKIKYALVNFRFSLKDNYRIILGYPLFADLPGSAKRQKRWKQSRHDTYEGSLLQFMRALFNNSTTETGFEIRQLVRKPNMEKERIKMRLNIQSPIQFIDYSSLHLPVDTINYFNSILKQSDHIDLLYKTLLEPKNIVSKSDSATAVLHFLQYLHITYTKKRPPIEYLQENRDAVYSSFSVSEITITDGHSIYIEDSGNFHDPIDFTISGYWAWWENLGSLIPLDYYPEIEKR